VKPKGEPTHEPFRFSLGAGEVRSGNAKNGMG
jgi:hypothetical protein